MNFVFHDVVFAFFLSLSLPLPPRLSCRGPILATFIRPTHVSAKKRGVDIINSSPRGNLRLLDHCLSVNLRNQSLAVSFPRSVPIKLCP